MNYQGKHYTRVVTISCQPKSHKKTINLGKIYQKKLERQVHKEVEGIFSQLGVSPRTIREVLEMQYPALDVVQEKPIKKFKPKRKRKFINDKRSS